MTQIKNTRMYAGKHGIYIHAGDLADNLETFALENPDKRVLTSEDALRMAANIIRKLALNFPGS